MDNHKSLDCLAKEDFEILHVSGFLDPLIE